MESVRIITFLKDLFYNVCELESVETPRNRLATKNPIKTGSTLNDYLLTNSFLTAVIDILILFSREFETKTYFVFFLTWS